MLHRLMPALLTVAAMFSAGTASAEDAVKLEVGDKAPAFSAVDDTGEKWESKDVVGKKILVVYFYPADFTGGCTKQACAYRDSFNQLKEKGVQVVGVSGDSVRGHQLFKKFHELNFTLLSDEDGSLAKTFGVPQRGGPGKVTTPEIDGKKEVVERGYTASRWTFVIGLDGTIKHKNTKVNAAQDSAAVLELLSAK